MMFSYSLHWDPHIGVSQLVMWCLITEIIWRPQICSLHDLSFTSVQVSNYSTYSILAPCEYLASHSLSTSSWSLNQLFHEKDAKQQFKIVSIPNVLFGIIM